MIPKDKKLRDLTVGEFENIIGESIRKELRYMIPHIDQQLKEFGEQIQLESYVNRRLILTATAVKKLLSVTDSGLHYWHKYGLLKRHKIGKKVFYFHDEIVRHIESNKNEYVGRDKTLSK